MQEANRGARRPAKDATDRPARAVTDAHQESCGGRGHRAVALVACSE
jgi:hypothetical protein